MGDDDALARRLGHAFANGALLDQALRHRSARHPVLGDYERLEFLGDALLGLVVAEALYRLPGELSEREMHLLRARLVCRESLAEVGRALGLTEHLRLGKGELRAGVGNRDSVISDAVEALIAAVYVDAGYAAARALILRLLGDRIERGRAAGTDRDAKGRLQEWLQARGLPLPSYETLRREGRDPEFTYHVACRVAARDAERVAIDRDVRQAEQKAAELMLAWLMEGGT